MSVGFVLLVHSEAERAGQVARHLALQGAPVVLHLDKRMSDRDVEPLKMRLADLDNVVICDRFACEWGSWALVQATQEAAALLLRRFPQVSHVYLASGSCLPLKPVAELDAFLSENSETDFIESATASEVPWAVGGLHDERFSMHFPFSWKKQRRLFDLSVALQERLGLQRTVPQNLIPHMGSQWWCLTRKTLTNILTDPRREVFEKYFKWVWIPDESYFQSLARFHAKKLESRSLTLTKFDFEGKPHIFYDDHMRLLEGSGYFFARKIWPGASELYDRFLNSTPQRSSNTKEGTRRIARVFDRARDRRTLGRAGLYMQSRFPNEAMSSGKTARPYIVFSGFDDLYEGFESWAAKNTGHLTHGHLFAPHRAEFAGRKRVLEGALTDNARLRDYNPTSFLTNMLWNNQEIQQSFLFGPEDKQDISSFLVGDKNARIYVISGAWAVSLFATGKSARELRSQAAWLQQTEAKFLHQLRERSAQAHIRIWSLAEFIARPMERMQSIVEEIATPQLRHLTEVPKMVELENLGDFLQDLKNMGMHPYLTGDYEEGVVQTLPSTSQIRVVGNG